MNRLVSIIVPIYKVEPYLRKCVDSLLSQNYSDIEIVLVDDGSPDKCPDIADEYAKTHINISTYHKKNGGLGDARNYGVQKAKGEWIAFVDSDDYVSDTYISDLVRLREKYDADVAMTRVNKEIEGKMARSHKMLQDECKDRNQTLLLVYGQRIIGWSAYGKLFKKDLLLKNPFPKGLYEDCACMYRIIWNCDCVAIGDYGDNYHYIIRDGSILHSIIRREHFHVFDICREFSEFIKNECPENELLSVLLYRNAEVQVLNLRGISYGTFKKIFLENRVLFRDKFIEIERSNWIPKKIKCYYLMQCTFSWLFWLFLKANILLNSLQFKIS